MKFAMKLAFAACLMLVMGLQAQAAQAKSFVLLPFEVHAPQNYSYLSKAVPSTLMGRLSATGATGSMGRGRLRCRGPQVHRRRRLRPVGHGERHGQ